MFNVELINIGTELLLGNVLNRHAAYLGRKLTELGGTLTRQVCVNDTPWDILDVLVDAMGRADLVITTGGLGPTSDDLTRNVVVDHLKLRTRVDAKVLSNIEERYKRRGTALPESAKAQAVVPESGEVLFNENGTAPGLVIPWIPGDQEGKSDPSKLSSETKWLVMLPGPPRELHPMFENQVVPWMKENFKGRLPRIENRTFRIAGMGESTVADKLEPELKGISELEIGYCAHPGEVEVRLMMRGNDEAKIRKNLDLAESKTRELFGNEIYGMGELKLEEAVVQLLNRKKKSITVAESCTGGFLSHRITMVSGSSEVFRKGFVVYSNEAKASMLGVPGHLIVEYGAVSSQVAQAMAECALKKAEADFALAITGIAGPTGGTEEKPVGTVYIALATKEGTLVEHQVYRYDRETFKFVVTQNALNRLRKKLI